MYLGQLHTDRVDTAELLLDFHEELSSIASTHRFIVAAVKRDFTLAYERLLSEHNPEFESYDQGDAISDAEHELGVTPWDVEAHQGMGALTRAVALAEVMLARFAGACFANPELTVLRRDRLWNRKTEGLFYKTCLLRPFNAGGNGFAQLRALRDLYVHGYGVPVVAEKHQHLAELLHAQFDTSPATDEEVALGYDGPASFFGPDAVYDTSEGLRDRLWSGLPNADLTPLATRRVLERVRHHIVKASEAVAGGLKEPLTVQNSKFVREIVRQMRVEA